MNTTDWSNWALLDYPDIIFFEKSVSLKYDDQVFEERLFVHLSIIIVLHYIACFFHQAKHLNIIKMYYWEI